MRSLGFTLILALLAILSCGLVGWKWVQGNFNSILGTPPTAVGERLYSSFSPAQVKRIQISQNSAIANFEKTAKGWQATAPGNDRMDPRAAIGIINFTLGMRVEDFAQSDDIDARKAGLKETNTNIRLEGENQTLLAKYKLGRQTPWLATVIGIEKSVPTVFVQPRDRDRKGYIYSCTGDITSMFKDGMKYLRDHRPFYFNPIALKKIRIRTEQGDLTLGRETINSPWRISKPLDLATDPKAMKSLLEGLYELQAAKVSDRSTDILPSNYLPEKSQQISLTSFNSETETILEIFPPETPESRDVKATVSDRPNTIFDLPFRPEPNLVSLADLPLTVNDLRDAKITNLDIQSIRGILIQSATSQEILISRTPPQPWMATIGGQSQEANEERLFTLLKAVTEGRVIGFETDAATDFGHRRSGVAQLIRLAQPPLGGQPQPVGNVVVQRTMHRAIGYAALRTARRLRLGEENQGIELAFGIDNNGSFFINRVGSSTVMKIDPSLISSIPIQPYEWRHDRLWSINKFNLMAIERKINQELPLMLRYEFNTEAWSASNDGKDLTASIDPMRANYILSTLEGLKVTRWLSPDDRPATEALFNPSLSIKMIENETENFKGLITREVLFAPSSAGKNPAFYYGRLSSETHPFLLDRETYHKLTADIFEKN